jgi:signal transduction histidine kinase
VKSEFLNIASHELRTPLTTLKLTVHQVASSIAAGEPARELHLARMDRQIARLSRMAGDLLDVSRLERGTLVVRPVPTDLRALVEETVLDLRPMAESRPLVLHVPDQPVPAHVDPDRVRQVLGNLVDNALKYSPPRAPIDVTLAAEDGWAQIGVRDSGAPFLPEQRARLFLPFARLRSPHHQEGLGLGLYLSREIAERHGGTLAVESDEEHGNCFVLALPREPRAS